MKNPLIYTVVSCLIGLSATAGSAQSQKRPPAPDFSAVAAEMGVSEAVLIGCMGGRPKPGQRPDRPNPANIAACLDDAGASVTSEAVDAALRANAPSPPPQ